MPRNKVYFECELPGTVADIVRAVCAGYDHRAFAISQAAVSGNVLARYIELNSAIDYALDDIERGLRRELLLDISCRRGYGRSSAQFFISKNTYYRRRRKLIYDIAKGLFLI